MKVMINGKEIEIDSEITPGERDFEEENNKEEVEEDLEDTMKLTEDEMAQIKEEREHE